MKIAVVSANFGGIDRAHPFPNQTVEHDRIIYTEANTPFPLLRLNNRQRAAYFKHQTHRVLDHDLIVWVDMNIEIVSPGFVEYMLAKALSHDIAIAAHPFRKSIYEEAESIMGGIKKRDPYLITRYEGTPILEEVQHYRDAGFPEDFGFWACNIFARWNNPKVNNMFNDWWDAFLKWGCFDQNAFPPVVRANDISINTLNFGSYYSNKFYHLHHHAKMQ